MKKKEKHLYYDSKADRWIVDYGGRKYRKRKFFRARNDAREFMLTREFLNSDSREVIQPMETKVFEHSHTSVPEAVRWYGDTISATKSRFSSRWEPQRLKEWMELHENKNLHEIGLKELLEYRSYLLNKKGYQPQTVNRRITLIKSFFKGCKGAGLIQNNPALELQKLSLPEPPHVEVISEQDQKKFLLEAKPWLKGPLWLAMKTGIRRNEVVNLRWGAVNLKEGYLLIEKSEGFQTKSKRTRQLPLTPAMIEMFSVLLTQAKERKDIGPNHFVFLTSTGQPILPDRLTLEAKKLMKRVLNREHGAVHIWRHSALTSMLQKGADIETVRRIAGHSSLVITQRYVHSNDVAMLKAISTLENSAGFGATVAVGASVSKKSRIYGGKSKTKKNCKPLLVKAL